MKVLIPLFLIVLLTSCSKTALQEDFNCSTSNLRNLEKITDFKNTFTVKAPKTWSTKLFYNNFETTIMTADSLKSFSKTYILNVSVISGNLILNDAFVNKIQQQLSTEEQLITDKHKFNTYKEMSSVWFLSHGKKGKFTYNYFQLFAKKSATEYVEISTKIFGDDLINERLCEAISIIENIEFIKP